MTREDPRSDDGSFTSALAYERSDVRRPRVPDPDAVLPAHVGVVHRDAPLHRSRGQLLRGDRLDRQLGRLFGGRVGGPRGPR